MHLFSGRQRSSATVDYVRVLVNEPWAFLSLFDDAKRERTKERMNANAVAL